MSYGIEEVDKFVERFNEEETEQDKKYLCQEMARAIRRCEESLEMEEDDDGYEAIEGIDFETEATRG